LDLRARPIPQGPLKIDRDEILEIFSRPYGT
jgi:hypothetical protein